MNGTLREAVGPFAAGTPYSAEDPALLLWVHATLIESILVTYEHLVGPLSRQDLDDYCAASVPSSIELGMRDAEAPRTWDDLQERLRRTYDSGVIAVGPQARELADAILRTSMPGPLAPARWISGLLTVGLLPPRVREDYGLTWDDTRQRRFDRLTTTVRTLRRITPASLAVWLTPGTASPCRDYRLPTAVARPTPNRIVEPTPERPWWLGILGSFELGIGSRELDVGG